jgi:AraC-like DNA-binding protein
MYGEVALRMLYVRTGPRGLFKDCAVVNVTPLLRELIVRTNLIGALEDHKPVQARLIAVILDELRTLRAAPLQLPLPRDPRALRFVNLTSQAPMAGPPPEDFVLKSGASRRTLERLFLEETSMTLGSWLRRQVLLHAVAKLGDGASVAAISGELGYSSPSAFIAMFRRELGRTPAKYFAAI